MDSFNILMPQPYNLIFLNKHLSNNKLLRILSYQKFHLSYGVSKKTNKTLVEQVEGVSPSLLSEPCLTVSHHTALRT